MQDDLQSLIAYNRWADDRLLEAVRRLTEEQYFAEPVPVGRSVHGILVHMADAMLIWVRRTDGETMNERPAEVAVPTLEDAVRLVHRAHDATSGLLPTLTPHDLAANLTFTDLRGEARSLPLWVILRHLPNHSSYHRGQITMRLMQFGIEPPLMDLPIWAGW